MLLIRETRSSKLRKILHLWKPGVRSLNLNYVKNDKYRGEVSEIQ